MNSGDTLTLELPEITRSTLALYAGASGDHNPVHIDIDACTAVGITDVFAHRMLSMAYLARLLTNYVAQERIRSYSVRFSAITPVNSTPSCTGTVVKVFENGLAHLDLTVILPDGTVTLQGSAVVKQKKSLKGHRRMKRTVYDEDHEAFRGHIRRFHRQGGRSRLRRLGSGEPAASRDLYRKLGELGVPASTSRNRTAAPARPATSSRRIMSEEAARAA